MADRLAIATWNVNSIKQRIGHLTAWVRTAQPDIVLLQELKATADSFPEFDVQAAGYTAAVVGQKSYNGVAVLSRDTIETQLTALPGDEDDSQARYLEVRTCGVRVASLYLPNGNPVDSPKYSYKLGWMDRLAARTDELLAGEEPVILGGDYNCAPTDDDVYDPEGFADDALCRLETRRRFRALEYRGMTEAWRALHGEKHVYSYWDYGAAFHNDDGLRIDHFLLSPQAADRLESCEIDTTPRGWERASDHTPVVCTLAA
ncbi:exodeoxyribonuclease-3 [Limimonas halophila]|uniref:Exodeoxyribonuclease-3 n=1 Tax=Limimonas halophila TaxID=1082479 RepID=A0A1G7NFQ2_9PROT|nr:exodeoxyribonuclease III [Limimonas halophila]SDF72915.1 exodeoxyribonuclease-3 [Limimonas halophila]